MIFHQCLENAFIANVVFPDRNKRHDAAPHPLKTDFVLSGKTFCGCEERLGQAPLLLVRQQFVAPIKDHRSKTQMVRLLEPSRIRIADSPDNRFPA